MKPMLNTACVANTWDKIGQEPRGNQSSSSADGKQPQKTPNDIVLYSDQCMVQPPSEKLPPAVHSPDIETHNWTAYRKWEVLQASVLRGMSPLNLFPQGSGSSVKRESVVLRTSGNGRHQAYRSDTQELTARQHTQGLHGTRTDGISEVRMGGRHKSYAHKGNLLSPTESHGAYKPHVKTALTPTSRCLPYYKLASLIGLLPMDYIFQSGVL